MLLGVLLLTVFNPACPAACSRTTCDLTTYFTFYPYLCFLLGAFWAVLGVYFIRRARTGLATSPLLPSVAVPYQPFQQPFAPSMAQAYPAQPYPTAEPYTYPAQSYAAQANPQPVLAPKVDSA